MLTRLNSQLWRPDKCSRDVIALFHFQGSRGIQWEQRECFRQTGETAVATVGEALPCWCVVLELARRDQDLCHCS